jgi:hypothetical protein
MEIATLDSLIYLIRSHRVMLDSDLAALYGVPTKQLNRAVRRNLGRFPDDFMFQPSAAELEDLRRQIGTSSLAWGGRRSAPLLFTEHGVAMLSSILNSQRAVRVNIEIIRAFIRLRQTIAVNPQLAAQMAKIERRLDEHEAENAAAIRAVFAEIRRLTATSRKTKRIGFPLSSSGTEAI